MSSKKYAGMNPASQAISRAIEMVEQRVALLNEEGISVCDSPNFLFYFFRNKVAVTCIASSFREGINPNCLIFPSLVNSLTSQIFFRK